MKTIQTQPAQISNPIDPQTIIKQGDSPTAIILAIALLLAVILNRQK